MASATISATLAALRTAVEAADTAAARKAADALSARRLSKKQKEEAQPLLAWVDEHAPAYNMSNHISKFRDRYELCISASGAKSLNNGDDVATLLEGKTAAEVMALADKHTPLKGQTHAERYQRLNEGQKRMNAGNKLRAAVRNGKLAVEDGKLV